jgi:hypothetical protein
MDEISRTNLKHWKLSWKKILRKMYLFPGSVAGNMGLERSTQRIVKPAHINDHTVLRGDARIGKKTLRHHSLRCSLQCLC